MTRIRQIKTDLIFLISVIRVICGKIFAGIRPLFSNVWTLLVFYSSLRILTADDADWADWADLIFSYPRLSASTCVIRGKIFVGIRPRIFKRHRFSYHFHI